MPLSAARVFTAIAKLRRATLHWHLPEPTATGTSSAEASFSTLSLLGYRHAVTSHTCDITTIRKHGEQLGLSLWLSRPCRASALKMSSGLYCLMRAVCDMTYRVSAACFCCPPSLVLIICGHRNMPACIRSDDWLWRDADRGLYFVIKCPSKR